MIKYNYEINDEEAIRKLAKIKDLRPARAFLREALTDSMRQVGLVATSKYMVQTRARFGKGGEVEITGRKVGKRLNIMTSRLMRSLVSAASFAQGATGGRETIKKIVFKQHEAVGEYGTRVPYAAIHEFGGQTSPHIIVPKRKKFLAFRGRDGKMVFTKKVKHPGSRIPPRPYLAPALRSSKQKIVEFVRHRMDQYLKTIK